MNEISTILTHMEWSLRAASEATRNPSDTDIVALRASLHKVKELADEGLNWAKLDVIGPMPDRFGRIE